MVRVDITCDLMDEDETGHVWALLRDARDQALIQPGAIVVAGDEDAPAVAEVVDIVDKPAGRVVHLRILPGQLEDYQAVIPASGHIGLTWFPVMPSASPAAGPSLAGRETCGEDDLPISPNTATSSHPHYGMRAVHGAFDLELHLWAILGSNQ